MRRRLSCSRRIGRQRGRRRISRRMRIGTISSSQRSSWIRRRIDSSRRRMWMRIGRRRKRWRRMRKRWRRMRIGRSSSSRR